MAPRIKIFCGTMDKIINAIKAAINFFTGFIDSLVNLVDTLGNVGGVVGIFGNFVPPLVFGYLTLGITLSIVLVILGRANK